MRVFGSGLLRAGGASILAAIVVSSCTAVIVEDGPRPLPVRPGPVLCTQDYDPVCARSRGNVRTFGNACAARAEGYRIINRGECRRAEAPQFCPREYRPVCGRRGPERRTFGNECEAESAGYRILYDGRC